MLSRRCPAASLHPSVIITLISNRFADCPRVNWIFQLEAATVSWLARRERGGTSPFPPIDRRASKKGRRKGTRDCEREKLERGWKTVNWREAVPGGPGTGGLAGP